VYRYIVAMIDKIIRSSRSNRVKFECVRLHACRSVCIGRVHGIQFHRHPDITMHLFYILDNRIRPLEKTPSLPSLAVTYSNNCLGKAPSFFLSSLGVACRSKGSRTKINPQRIGWPAACCVDNLH
jgi:hypothetical protein